MVLDLHYFDILAIVTIKINMANRIARYLDLLVLSSRFLFFWTLIKNNINIKVIVNPDAVIRTLFVTDVKTNNEITHKITRPSISGT